MNEYIYFFFCDHKILVMRRKYVLSRTLENYERKITLLVNEIAAQARSF